VNPISASRLRWLRNQIPIVSIVTALDLPTKSPEGIFRFLCPICSGFDTATNPRTNLARCFRCQRNFNPIDLVMIVQRCRFLAAVNYLETFANRQNPALSGRH
jgi:hypothetical protein